MDDYRFAQLETRLAQVERELDDARHHVDALQESEQRLLQVETDLAASHRLIDDLQHGTTRSRFLGRVSTALTACGLTAVLALTVGPATAAPGPQQLTVKTPFEVQNQAGRVIFRVAEQTGEGSGVVTVSDNDGKALVALQPNESGGSGEVVVRGVQPGQVARLSSLGGDLSLRFYTGANLLAGMGAIANGGILELYDKKGTKMTKIGNNGYGGTLETYNNDGQVRDLLSNSRTGRGGFDIFNESGNIVATLAAAGNGGYFSLASNASGAARVTAGINSSDAGIVSATGPKNFNSIQGS
jgi:hypothetical protein